MKQYTSVYYNMLNKIEQAGSNDRLKLLAWLVYTNIVLTVGERKKLADSLINRAKQIS